MIARSLPPRGAWDGCCHEARSHLRMVGAARRNVAPRPLPPARPGAGRIRRGTDRTAHPRAPGRGAPLSDGAPGAGDGSDEPAGPGLRLSDGAGQQAGLRRGPVRHGRPGGAGRGAGAPAGTARPAGLAVRPGRRPPFLIGHAAAVAAPARPAGGPAGNALARRRAGGGRTPRSRRRRRPAVAGGAQRPGHPAHPVPPHRRHAPAAARLGAAGQVRRAGEAAAEPRGGRSRAGAPSPGNAIAFASVPASHRRGGAAGLLGGDGGAPGRLRARPPGPGPRPARGPEPRLDGRPQADRRAPRLPPPGGPHPAQVHLETAAPAPAYAAVTDQPATFFVVLLVVVNLTVWCVYAVEMLRAR